ncbi:hypothetical protein BJ508DRAFT_161614 [Ascobolus immersus RN42]|uniref:C2H2-type domain-containing protein n=1 Tax=Ascobolus immersus RN42 TaxID=1160509 RepID=A0A3N4I1A9_ASCIM|nr:hypothetical protein BJ508DRAFT_161614 [Ascobolus immersus RN42]
MTKKSHNHASGGGSGAGTKRKVTNLQEALERPWCYYCERDFDDLKILINHQKAKHYKCSRCQRRLNTAGGLAVHMTQVHKETLDAIENAIPGRESVDVEIFGVEGIPEVELIAHKQRIISQFQQDETDRRNSTNGGGQHGGPAKKPKIEKLDPAEIKRRLAEHKAKMAEQNAAANGASPVQPGFQAGGSQSPPSAPAAFSPGGIPQQVQPPAQGFYGQPPTAPYAYGQAPVQPGQPPYQQGQSFQNGQYISAHPPAPQQFNGPPGPGGPYGFPPHQQGFSPAPPGNMSQGPPHFNPHQHQPYPHQSGFPPGPPASLPQPPSGLPPRPAALPPRPAFVGGPPSFPPPPPSPMTGAPGAGHMGNHPHGFNPSLPSVPPHLPPTPHVKPTPVPPHIPPPQQHQQPSQSLPTHPPNLPLPVNPVSRSPLPHQSNAGVAPVAAHPPPPTQPAQQAQASIQSSKRVDIPLPPPPVKSPVTTITTDTSVAQSSSNNKDSSSAAVLPPAPNGTTPALSSLVVVGGSDQAAAGAAQGAATPVKRPQRLIYSDNDVSPEEKRAKLSRYAL